MHGEAAGTWGLTFEHDALGNIVALHEPYAGTSDQDDGSTLPLGDPVETYTYDALSRLTGVYDNDDALIEGYTYDATGNRLTKRYYSGGEGEGDDNGDGDGSRTPVTPVGASEIVETYAYGTTSHRVTAIHGFARTYDANGNTTQLTNDTGTFALTYADHNRLAAVHSGSTQVGSYVYNGRGERVRKMAGSTDLVFVYNEGEQLIGEYSGGNAVREYVWLDNLPVGVLVGGVLYAIESDHLGAPRRAFEVATQSTVWQWVFQGNPFGDRMPEGGEANDGGASIELPLRYAGQYDDPESGVYYNYHRDYEAGTGRYIESDPIGQDGGPHLYAYVGGMPLLWNDPSGLLVEGSRADYCYGQPDWVCRNSPHPSPTLSGLVKQCICKYLQPAAFPYDAGLAFSLANRARKAPGKWNDPVLRPCENYLYGYSLVADHGTFVPVAAAGVELHHVLKYVRSNTSPPSQPARDAGMQGVLDGGQKKNLQKYCEGICRDGFEN